MPPSTTRQRCASLAAAGLLALVTAPAAWATSVPCAGSFIDDDDLHALNFSFATAETLSAHTLSHGDGPDSLGLVVAAGGFAPVLSLFDAAGLLLQTVAGSAATCGSGGGGAVDPASGFCWDAGFSTVLSAGDYTLVLSQDGNLPLGPYFADGYSMTGNPDYTGLAWPGWAWAGGASSTPTGRSATTGLTGAMGATGAIGPAGPMNVTYVRHETSIHGNSHDRALPALGLVSGEGRGDHSAGGRAGDCARASARFGARSGLMYRRRC